MPCDCCNKLKNYQQIKNNTNNAINISNDNSNTRIGNLEGVDAFLVWLFANKDASVASSVWLPWLSTKKPGHPRHGLNLAH